MGIGKSRSEIKTTLERYGTDAFRYSKREGLAIIEFAARDRHVRFVLPLPRRDETQFTTNRWGHERPADAAYKSWEQACRQRWRALSLAIKAKLETVECGIAEFEDEFLAYVVDPATDRTVSEVIRPQLAASYEGMRGEGLLLTDQRQRKNSARSG